MLAFETSNGLAVTWNEVRAFTTAIAWHFKNPQCLIDEVAFQEDLIVLVRKLTYMLDAARVGEERLRTLGALILLRTFERPIAALKVRSKLIIEDMVRTSSSLTAVADQNLLLWTITFGGMVTDDGSPEQALLISHIHSVNPNLYKFDDSLGDWFQVRRVLENFPWVEEIHEVPCKLFWEKSSLYPP